MRCIVAILCLLPFSAIAQPYNPALVSELIHKLETEIELARTESQLAKAEAVRAVQQTAAMRETLWLAQSEQHKALKERDLALADLAITKSELREAVAARYVAERHAFWSGLFSTAFAGSLCFGILYFLGIPALHPWAFAGSIAGSALFASVIWLLPFFLS